MNLILHIGAEKTGTTSFQYWLQENYNQLYQNNIYVSKSLGQPANNKLVAYCHDFSSGNHNFLNCNINNKKELENFRTKLKEEFEKELSELPKNSISTYIISSEFLQSLLLKEEMVERAKNFLQSYFSNILVICFLRPHVDVLLSLLSTMSAAGHIIDVASFDADKNDVYFDYLALYRRWKSCFDNFCFVSYKKNNNIVDYFKILLGVDDTEFADVGRRNSALDYRMIALRNNILPMPLSARKTLLDRREFLEGKPAKYPLTVSLAQARVVHARFRRQITQLVRECEDLTLDDLTPDWNRFPERGNIERVEEVVFKPQLQYVLMRLNAELWVERARANLAEAKLASMNGNTVRAGQLVAHCNDCIANARQLGIRELSEKCDLIQQHCEKLSDQI